MTVGVTADVEYDERRGMWRVDVYRNGVWHEVTFFHTEIFARKYAAEVRARG